MANTPSVRPSIPANLATTRSDGRGKQHLRVSTLPPWMLGPAVPGGADLPVANAPMAAAVAAPQEKRDTPTWKIMIQGAIDPKNPDYVDDKTARQMLVIALDKLWPTLPTADRIIARRVTFSINHDPVFRAFLGYAAEDDPEYTYGDTQLYPAGSIKVNFTTKFIKSIQLSLDVLRANRASPEYARIEQGFHLYLENYGRHEIRHAHQYMTGPVRDLGRIGKPIPSDFIANRGVASEDLLLGHAAKRNYEENAIGLGHQIYARSPETIQAVRTFGDAVQRFAADPKHSHLFDGDTGKYRLVTPNATNGFVARYLVDELEQAVTKPGFGPGADMVYNGQLVPAEVVFELHHLTNRLSAESDPATLTLQLADFHAKWEKYVSKNKLFRMGVLPGMFPQLWLTKAAFGAEAHRVADKVRALGWDVETTLGAFAVNVTGTKAEAEAKLDEAIDNAKKYNARMKELAERKK